MPITLVQSKLGTLGSGTTSATAGPSAFTSNTTAGNLLVCVAWAKATIATGASPTISAPVTSGLTWVSAKNDTMVDSTNGFGSAVTIFYVANAPSVSSATTTTVAASRASATALAVQFTLYEFSGVATTTPLDTTVGANSSSTSPITATNITTAGAGELIVVAYQSEGGSNTTAGTNYTLGPNGTGAPVAQSQYNLNSTSGAQSTAFGGSYAGVSYCCAAAAFIPGAAPGFCSIASFFS